MANMNWHDAPKSAAAIRLLREVQKARTFGEIDEVCCAAQMQFARQQMEEWEFTGIQKYAFFQRTFLSDDLAKGRVRTTG